MCTFCEKESIMKDVDLQVEYCEYHAKMMQTILEKEKNK